MSKSKRKSKKKKQPQNHGVPDAAIPCQIYLLTPPRIDDVAAFAKTLEAVLASTPVACLQIRLKDAPKDRVIDIAKQLIPIAHQYGTLVLINDDPEIAAECGADGVHLGQLDMNINLAKTLLPEGALIGVTCHNSRELAFRAGSDGADYVAFGAFYETSTKPGAQIADLEIITWWHEAIEIPCVAIGGITPDNAQAVIAAGADFIAISSGIWDWRDGPVAAVKQLAELCTQHSPLD